MSRLPAVWLGLLLVTTALGAQEAPENEPLGAGSAFRPEAAAAPQTLQVAAGTRVLYKPDPRSPAMTTVETDAELEVLERRPGWARVRVAEWNGWIALSPAAPEAEPAAAAEPATPSADPPGALELLTPLGIAADPERVEAIRTILGEDGEPRRLGPFTLYSDIEPEFFRLLEPSVLDLTAAYLERFGLETDPGPELVAVVFSRLDAYKRYEGLEASLTGLDVPGHAGRGIAAVFAESRRPAPLRPLLLHELVHLLNRLALGQGVPAWLEEGLANDLAYNRVDRQGRLRLGTLEGRRTEIQESRRGSRGRSRRTIQYDGPLASYSLLLRQAAAGELYPLRVLTDLTWLEFAEPEGRELRYIQATYVVRFLLDSDPRLAVAFRNYLADLAAGGAASGQPLDAALGASWDYLETAWQRWLANSPTPQ